MNMGINNRCSSQRGAILVVLIVTMVIAAVLGTSMIYFTSTSTFSELFANSRARAYYLAEAGGRYATPIIISDLAKGVAASDTQARLNKTFSFDGNNQVEITVIKNDLNNTTTLTSVGKVPTGGWFYTKQQLKWTISYASMGFTTNFEARPLSDYWAFDSTGSEASIKKDGGSSSLALKVDVSDPEALIGLKWSGSAVNFNLSNIWTANGNLLSYDVQVKVASSPSGNITDQDFFLTGLSFRLDMNNTDINKDDDKYYGLSFFWAKSISGMTPATSATGTSLKTMVSVLEDDKTYVILFKKIGNTLTLIDYTELTVSEYPNLVAYSPPFDNRVKNHNYAIGDIVWPLAPNGRHYRCIVAGQSVNSTTEPAWPNTDGGQIVDGTVTWQESKAGTQLNSWSTLLVMVREGFTDPPTNSIRRNSLTAYVQGSSVYPRDTTPIRWVSSELVVPTPNFSYVKWFLPQSGAPPEVQSNPCDLTYLPNHCSPEVSETILDSTQTLTTYAFDTRSPNEIGLHSFQNSNAAREIFLDDLAVQLPGGGGGTGGVVSQQH